MNKQKEVLFNNLLKSFRDLNISSKLFNITSRQSKYRLNNILLENIVINIKYLTKAIFLKEKIKIKSIFREAIETEKEVNSSRSSGLLLFFRNNLSMLGFYITYLVIDDIRKNEKPTTIFQWGSYLPLQRFMKKYFEKNNIKVIHSEFGMLPGTIIFEDNYINSFSLMNNKIYYNSLVVDKYDLKFAENSIEKIRNNQLSNKDYSKKLDASKSQFNFDSFSKVVFIAGIVEIPGGLKPYHLDPNPNFSPLFKSNQEIVDYIDKVALELNYLVLYKEHPLVRSYPKQQVSSKGLKCTRIIDKSVDIYSILDISDVTITIGSSVSYLSMILNLPCINLGKNSASSKDIFMEVNSIEELKTMLVNSFYIENSETNFIKYIAKELKYHMFYLDGNDKYYDYKIEQLINKTIT